MNPKLIKCIYCGKTTSLHYINVQKKVKGKIITLTGAPVYFCQPCNETFLTKETQEVFRYIQDNNLDEKLIMYNFESMVKKLPSNV
ncbi:MAG: YgiT-type zinc finger protein [Clostridiales bacterium]|nr:YgiT-type zinc finger protein [Clostridiales bacterium]